MKRSRSEFKRRRHHLPPKRFGKCTHHIRRIWRREKWAINFKNMKWKQEVKQIVKVDKKESLNCLSIIHSLPEHTLMEVLELLDPMSDGKERTFNFFNEILIDSLLNINRNG